MEHIIECIDDDMDNVSSSSNSRNYTAVCSISHSEIQFDTQRQQNVNILDVLPYKDTCIDVLPEVAHAFTFANLKCIELSEAKCKVSGVKLTTDEKRVARNQRARLAYASMEPLKKELFLARKRANYAAKLYRFPSVTISESPSSSYGSEFLMHNLKRSVPVHLAATPHVSISTYAEGNDVHSSIGREITEGNYNFVHSQLKDITSTYEHGSSSTTECFQMIPQLIHFPDSSSQQCKSKQLVIENRFTRLSSLPTVIWSLPEVPSCYFCKAKRFYREPPSFCCCSGNVLLAEINIHPILYDLFTNVESSVGHEFRRRARSYNNAFAFTSLGMKTDRELCCSNKGVYSLRVLGQVGHYLPSLLPTGESIRSLQLYFYETAEEIDQNLLTSNDLRFDIVALLMEVSKANPYTIFFRSLQSCRNLRDFNIVIRSEPGLDQRVFNVPSVSQIAAIWNDCDDIPDGYERDIRPGWHTGIPKMFSTDKNSRKRKVNYIEESLLNPTKYNSSVELLEMEKSVLEANKRSRTNVSCREYSCYRAQIRENDRSFILHSGRLGHQYAIDMYIKLETSRLDYYRLEQQQENARMESVQGLVDSLAIHGENDPQQVGRRIVLPSSFIGGPRDMRKRYINAMSLVQKFGKPDIFLTMTCNPQWNEITENLWPGERPDDRPDLIARVFHAKLEEMKNDIVKKSLFGQVAAYVYVVEFQKRGLPHAHWIVILKPQHKIISFEIYDDIISAELPDPQDHPFLHSYVTRHMLHGPCGNLNPKNACMRDGQCKNRFPKSFCSSTVHGKDSYPNYRRRDDGRTVKVHKFWLDNRWVVPYNPYLLAKFNCHINVEICSDIKLVKYLYKYIYKGHDRVAYNVVEHGAENFTDEIHNFQTGRWISAPEAYWRTFGFPMSEMYPPIIVLQVHLENQQFVSFRRQYSIEQILQNPMLHKTMLTEFFWMNAHDESAKHLNLLYVEFPEYFVWQAQYKTWKLREKQFVVGRLATVGPAEGERYFERLLLMHVRCPVSFADLLTFKGKRYNTFRDAALCRGLLKSDNYVEECLEEAATYQMPYSLRHLFATTLVYCAPADPYLLWNKFYNVLSEDFAANINFSKEEVRQHTLSSIDSMLLSMGRSIREYFIGMISMKDMRFSKDYEHEYNLSMSETDILSKDHLNSTQRNIFNVVIQAIYLRKGGAFFVDGPGGTGKTYLYRSILAFVRSRGGIALAVATSGVAAALLPGGRTAHSRFKLPLHKDDKCDGNIGKQTSLANMIRACQIIIWDEASMASRHCIEAFDRTLQDITDSSTLFGGKVVLFGGDFRQTLPVVPKGNKEDFIGASFVTSHLWFNIQLFQLTENMRARDDPDFVSFLLRVGEGREPYVFEDNIVIPSEMMVPFVDTVTSLNILITFVFPSFDLYFSNPHSVANRAILAPKNESVDELNTLLIHKFPGELKEYVSFDTTSDSTQQGQYEDFLNSVNVGGLPPHKLQLKKKCPVILLRNLNPTEGLCNGTQLICHQLGTNFIGAEIACGEFQGKYVFIPRIPLETNDSLRCPIPFKRTQFPIRLCFAMTINRAQGQTLDFVGIYLREPVFSHGQLYVALSRARSSNTVKVLIQPCNPSAATIHYTRNIVYKEVLNIMRHN